MSDARLRVSDPQGRRFVVLDKDLFTIGRRTDADLKIGSTDVSRDHAEIVRRGKRYILRDRGSRYGTFVNGEAVSERPLISGDRIRLGRTEAVELVFQGAGDPPSGLRDGLRETQPDVDLRQMAAILNGLRALGSGRVLTEVLTLVTDSAIDVTKAERGFIMMANERGDLECQVARGRGGITLAGTSFLTSAKIPRDVFATGQMRIERDLTEDPTLAAVHDGTISIGIRYVLCVPLKVVPMSDGDAAATVGERILGVLYLDSRERSAMLLPATQKSLDAFATQAAIAIESARLYAEAAEKGRIERELRVAAEIQRALLADPAFDGPFCELAATSIPSRVVGGDFYDYLELPDGRFAFALGDVAGKGAAAALQAAAVQTNFAALAPVGQTPADTVHRINRALLRRAVDARFATMFYGLLAPGGLLQYSNAGQDPPFVVRRRDPILLLDRGGPVVGVLHGAAYEDGEIQLEAGDLVVVYSDGVTEATDERGEEFGRDRILAAIRGCHGARPDAALDALVAAMRQFAGTAPQFDDVTVLVVRYRGMPS